MANRIYLELKRRRLPQTAAWYVAVAWGGTEILAFLTDALLGEAAATAIRRYLAIFLIAGFPAAMYLAWTRDLGVRARRYLSAGIVSVLVIAVLVAVVPDEHTLPFEENSIAVLPFDTCAERTSDRPLANGLMSAVHSRLTARNGLHVKSLASVQTVMEKLPPLSEAAKLLEASYFLDGIVCRDGRDPTATVELINRQGQVVWKNEFTQVANEHGQVSVQLADLIEQGVAREFGDVSTPEPLPAVSAEALMNVRVGYGYLYDGQPDRAIEVFETALEIEPEYAEAIYGQALAASRMWTPDEFAPARRIAYETAEKALATARAAVKRDPRDFEANFFAGHVLHYLGDWGSQLAFREFSSRGSEAVEAYLDEADQRFAEAHKYLEAALANRPDDAEARYLLTHNMDSLGADMRRASIEIRQQGLSVDPFNKSFARGLARRMIEFGDVPGAMDVLDRFAQLPQGKRDVWWQQLESLNNTGRHDLLLAYYIEMLEGDRAQMSGGDVLHIWRTVGWIAHVGLYQEASTLKEQVWAVDNVHPATPFFRRLFDNFYLQATGRSAEAARNTLERAAGLSNEEILDSWHVKSGPIARAFWDTGERGRAIELMEALAQYRQNTSGWAERQMIFPLTLARWYFAEGRDAEAWPVLDFIVSNLEAEVLAGVRHPHTLLMLAEAYGWQANTESALRTLEMAVAYGAFDMRVCCQDYWSEAMRAAELDRLGQRNWWDSLEGSDEFELIRVDMRSNVDAQRNKIRALLGQHDMGDLLKPWMTPAAVDHVS